MDQSYHEQSLVDESSSRSAKAAGLRIARIDTTVVNIPHLAPYVWATGNNPGATRVMVQVTTEDGLVGLGEAPHWRMAELIDNDLAPRLVGQSAYDLRSCWRRCVPPVETLRSTDPADVLRAFGGIEIALWDIRAKASGIPLYQLLGGAVRTEIPVCEYFSARLASNGHGGERTPAEIAEYCQQMIENYDSPWFEGKVGYSDLETDIAIVAAVRAAIGPERTLRLDANMAWHPETARVALRRLEAFEVANIEDPTVAFEDMAKLRQHSSIPFSTHAADLRRAVCLGVPDSFVLNVTALGGIARTLRFIGACEATGIGFSFYSGDTGIGTAVYLQLAAADPHLKTPSQTLVRWYADDVIEGGPFEPRRGMLSVPDGPGLGVTLDEAALKRAHRRFEDDGPYDQFGLDDEGYYRHVPAY